MSDSSAQDIGAVVVDDRAVVADILRVNLQILPRAGFGTRSRLEELGVFAIVAVPQHVLLIIRRDWLPCIAQHVCAFRDGFGGEHAQLERWTGKTAPNKTPPARYRVRRAGGRASTVAQWHTKGGDVSQASSGGGSARRQCASAVRVGSARRQSGGC